MAEYNKTEKDIETNIDKGEIKLHYDYKSYENILNKSITNTLDLLKTKEEYNTELIIPINQNNNLNLNLENFAIKNTKEIKNNYLNFIPSLSLYTPKINENINFNDNNDNNKNMFSFSNNLNEEIKLNYNEEKKLNEYKYNKINNTKLQKYRNNSFNYNKIKIGSKPNKTNLAIYNFEKALKFQENNISDNENEKFDKKNYKAEYNKINKDNTDNKKFYSTFNQLPDFQMTTNEEIETYNKINEINNIISEENKTNIINKNNKENKKLHNYKSTPHINSYLNSDLFNYPKNNFEKLKNELYLENNKLCNEKKDIISKYKILKAKYELLAKDNFIIKAKYEVSKNNRKLLQKKLEDKNYEIGQMKKILLSNNHQINFLNTLKDSNIKTTKDNEE